MITCPLCSSKVTRTYMSYQSKILDKDTGDPVVIMDVLVYKCTNPECNHSFLPYDQEKKVDRGIIKRTCSDLLH